MSRDALPPLRDVIDAHGLRTKKSLGQHFLLDTNLTDKIARLAGDISHHTVIEVGPGPGGLTRSLLLAGAGRVVAIEKDERCLPVLAALKAYAGDRFDYIQADASEVSCATIGQPPRAVVANLPYNVGTSLLLGWLDDISQSSDAYSGLTLMFQREVAERITAKPFSKAYGRISILAQWLCEVHLLMPVPAAAFVPPPKVDSAVIQLIPRKSPLFPASKAALEKVVAIAFQQRRKMLKSALKPLSSALVDQLTDAGFDVTLRPDQLSVEDYCMIARRYEALR